MKLLYAFLLLTWLVIAGCAGTRAIYGIPASEWEHKDPVERQATIEHFKQQEKIYAKTRAQAEKTRAQAKAFEQDEAKIFANQCHPPKDSPFDYGKCKVISRRR